MSARPSVEDIDGWLPQTQCTRCGYPRCMAYAIAIRDGRAAINQCPPGGDETIDGLARLLDIEASPLDPAFGSRRPRVLAVIDESLCIGCTLCIQACPVDAIVGAAKRMHTVLVEDCTGCELCLPPCPVDCIDTVPAEQVVGDSERRWPEYSPEQVRRARERTQARIDRLRRVDRDRALKRKHRETRRQGAAQRIRKEIDAAVRSEDKRPDAHV